MSYLRFHPHEYEAIARACRPLDLRSHLPHTLKRFLVAALADGHAALAERVACFPPWKLQILLRHLQDLQPAAATPAFTDAEVEALADAFGPLLAFARSGRLLKRSVVRCLLADRPDLAGKVHRLNPEQFEALCGQVRRRLRRGA
jgi:hypothetical protein